MGAVFLIGHPLRSSLVSTLASERGRGAGAVPVRSAFVGLMIGILVAVPAAVILALVVSWWPSRSAVRAGPAQQLRTE